MKKYKYWILITLGIIICINLFMHLKKNYAFSQEDYFNSIVQKSYEQSYKGEVKKKFFEKNGTRKMMIIDHHGIETKLDFVFQKQGFYEFVNIGDTIIKPKNSNILKLKRGEFDTLIKLKFANIKGAGEYSKSNKYLNN